MAEAMASTAKAMHKMNKAVDVPAINKMMAEFERENAKTDIMILFAWYHIVLFVG